MRRICYPQMILRQLRAQRMPSVLRAVTRIIICLAIIVESKRDPYEVLGVRRSASQDEVKATWKKLARKL